MHCQTSDRSRRRTAPWPNRRNYRGFRFARKNRYPRCGIEGSESSSKWMQAARTSPGFSACPVDPGNHGLQSGQSNGAIRRQIKQPWSFRRHWRFRRPNRQSGTGLPKRRAGVFYGTGRAGEEWLARWPIWAPMQTKPFLENRALADRSHLWPNAGETDEEGRKGQTLLVARNRLSIAIGLPPDRQSAAAGAWRHCTHTPHRWAFFNQICAGPGQ